jgi:hypothetical protein
MVFKPTALVIHCSATKDGEAVSWGAIRKWHMGLHPKSPYRTEPWSDIGYHWGVEYVGVDAEVLMGRMPDVMGAHAGGHNSYTLGVCVVGDFDKYPPSEIIWNKTVVLCRWIVKEFGIKEVLAHREISETKTCPGTKFDIAAFRMELKYGILR